MPPSIPGPRAEKVSGHFSIRSTPGQGTEVELHVPHLEFLTPVSSQTTHSRA